MKDLYARLGIDRTASADEIAASAAQRPDLQECASILLDAGKRSVYDRAHANLKLIGELRRRLHLDTGDSWFLKNYADFAAKHSAPPAPAAPAPQPAPANPQPAPAIAQPAPAIAQPAPARPQQQPAAAPRARLEAARKHPPARRTISTPLVLAIGVVLGVLAVLLYLALVR